MSKKKGKKSKGILKFEGMRIEKRLKKAFNIVTVFSAITSLVGLIAIIIDIKNTLCNIFDLFI